MRRLRASTFSRTASSSAEVDARSPRSPTRMPRRATLSAYAGPIPREVVPIFRLPRLASGEHVELAVVRQDEVRAVADHQAALDEDAELLELLDLGEQRRRIDHHPVAEHADRVRVEDARGNQPQHELRARDEDRVPRVVAALVPGHGREMWSEQIDELALALVAPLRAKHRDIHERVVESGSAHQGTAPTDPGRAGATYADVRA